MNPSIDTKYGLRENIYSKKFYNNFLKRIIISVN